MPNRYVREDAIESEPVNAVTWQAEVFYRRLLNRVDDFGRYTAHRELLRASIFPLQLQRVSAADVGRLLRECEDAGLVFTYNVSGKDFLVVNKWERGRAKFSEYPDPPAEVCERMQTFVYRCKQPRTKVPDSDSDTDSGSDSDKDAAAPPLPFASAEFIEAWSDFERHRREKRKPLTPTSRKYALRDLAEMGEARAIAALKHTVSKGWQGIREPEKHHGKGATTSYAGSF